MLCAFVFQVGRSVGRSVGQSVDRLIDLLLLVDFSLTNYTPTEPNLSHNASDTNQIVSPAHSHTTLTLLHQARSPSELAGRQESCPAAAVLRSEVVEERNSLNITIFISHFNNPSTTSLTSCFISYLLSRYNLE